MRLIIDIDEETVHNVRAHGLFLNPRDDQNLVNAIKNGIPIPDNDCNNCEKAWTDKCERAECYENNYKHWTPYQKGTMK